MKGIGEFMSKTIDEKIKKLLRLVGSDNEHEARLAMARARKLMAEYKLDIKDFDESNKKVVEVRTDIYWTPYKNAYIGSLANLIADKYCCVVYSTQTCGSTKRYVTIRGYEEDVRVFENILKFATDCVNKWFKKAKKDEYFYYTAQNQNAIKNTYGYGFAQGLNDLLEEQMRNMEEQNWGLVMVVPQEAKDYLSTLRTSRVRTNTSSNAIIRGRGYSDGKNANFNSYLS